MATVPQPPSTGNVVNIHDRAHDNLRFIRNMMEGASSFTAVSGWGLMGIGVLGCIAFALGLSAPTISDWANRWLSVAPAALAIGGVSMAVKARRRNTVVLSASGRKFLFNLVPPLVAALLLTGYLLQMEQLAALPGLWLLLYGTGIVTGGSASVRSVPVMGLCFFVLGAAALFTPAWLQQWLMLAGFGGLHLGFGAYIAYRHDG